MRNKVTLSIALGSSLYAIAFLHAQNPQQDSPTIDAVVERIAKSEAALSARLRSLHPIVEVYVQTLGADPTLGAVPTRDDYFLGQFDGKDRPRLTSLSPRSGAFHDAARMTTVQYLPSGFAAVTVPDWTPLDAKRYDFSFVRREFLGEARTLVFDVRLKNGRGDGFAGRIWAEDRDYNIVRFNGINRDVDLTMTSFFTLTSLRRKKLPFHVDGWRANVAPGVWLPAYIYCEEADLGTREASPTPRIKSQIRLWGYRRRTTSSQSEFSTIQVDSPAVEDHTDSAPQLSPVESQRLWEQQAESNVVDRLARASLLAPRGPVDKILETVLNNVQVTSNVALDAPVKTRVLLTQPLESFTVGHTIVISRGLIDVLPDEASLAMVLGHELSHIALGHMLIDTKFAFADRLMVSDGDLLKTLRFRHAQSDESAADKKAVELLTASPYKDKLSNGGLFLRAVAANAKALTNLIQPHLGDFVVEGGLPLTPIVDTAPRLEPERLDQIAALPLGARIVVDPWSDQVDLLRTPPVPLASLREKIPLAITRLMPYLRYADASSASQQQ